MFKLNTKQKIEDWLENNTITNYTIHDDLTVDVYEDVWITKRRKKLPFQFGIVEGNFFSSNMGLESLEGAPRIVTGLFRCSSNPITSLKYSPVEVGGDFICNHTKITDLQFSPKTVGGFFDCGSCELISLFGCPKKINSYFNCSSNKLQSFEYSPELINGAFSAAFNEFKSFKHFPQKVEYATLNGNPLLTIDMLDDLLDCTFDSIICDFALNKEESLKVLNIIKAKKEKKILDNSILKNSDNKSKKRL
jgi:hypothetical protein